MSGLVNFCQSELDNLLKTCKDSSSLQMQRVMNNDIMEIVKTFCNQHHSGFSAGYALELVNRLLNYKPISALTGEDNEWEELDYVGDEICYQNKRCPSVFKTKAGRAYNVEGRIFSSDNGHTWYRCKDSSVDITFPYYVPDRPEYVVIDNKKERDNLCNDIIDICNSINPTDTDVLVTVDEDTRLVQMIPEEKIKVLEEVIKDKYKIAKLLFNLDSESCIWQVVNLIMESDKVEEDNA